jgi:hypothetical protein
VDYAGNPSQHSGDRHWLYFRDKVFSTHSHL